MVGSGSADPSSHTHQEVPLPSFPTHPSGSPSLARGEPSQPLGASAAMGSVESGLTTSIWFSLSCLFHCDFYFSLFFSCSCHFVSLPPSSHFKYKSNTYSLKNTAVHKCRKVHYESLLPSRLGHLLHVFCQTRISHTYSMSFARQGFPKCQSLET